MIFFGVGFSMIFLYFFPFLEQKWEPNGGGDLTFLTYFSDPFLDRSQRSFWGGSGIDFGWILEDLGSIWGAFWEHFGNDAFWLYL